MLKNKSQKFDTSKPLRIDFSKAQTRKGLPEGDYLFEVKKVEIKEGQAAPYLNLELVVIDEGENDGQEGKKHYDKLSLSEAALWRLRAFLEAAGMDVPEEAADIIPDELVGLQLGGTVILKAGRDKVVRPTISVYFPTSDFEIPDGAFDDAEEEEEEE